MYFILESWNERPSFLIPLEIDFFITVIAWLKIKSFCKEMDNQWKERFLLVGKRFSCTLIYPVTYSNLYYIIFQIFFLISTLSFLEVAVVMQTYNQ